MRRAIHFLLFFFFAFLIFSGACKNLSHGKGGSAAYIKGTLTNLTGLDGCGWVIRLDKKLPDGTDKLEPVNLSSFDVALSEGAHVAFIYHGYAAASICMVGKLVELDQIR